MEKILVVEDEDAVRKLTARMLQIIGYETLEAEDGSQALDICSEHAGEIDLIITDMIMPKMDGKQLVEELKNRGQESKVLFVSGYSADDTVNGQALGQGVAFIQKPFTREGLARKVGELLGKSD